MAEVVNNGRHMKMWLYNVYDMEIIRTVHSYI